MQQSNVSEVKRTETGGHRQRTSVQPERVGTNLGRDSQPLSSRVQHREAESRDADDEHRDTGQDSEQIPESLTARGGRETER
ncbi:hypothetical protein FKP32DRAFT_1591013 [Trametes sanguinea]|nr:hypothetical protein FKP32DRAFT_1591013 [Trametes sanguinea]